MRQQEVNGIINQAKTAKAKSAHAQVFEQMQIEEIMCAKGNKTLIEYLQEKHIIGNEIGEKTGIYQINIQNLLEQEIDYGNGIATESTKRDVYMLEEQEETNSMGEQKYKVVYLGKKSNEIEPLGLIYGDKNTENYVDEFNIGDKVTTANLETFQDNSVNIDWIYFGKDNEGNNLITTVRPLNVQFELNNQPVNATDDDKIGNSASNWLYYALKEGDAGYTDSECTIDNNINKYCESLYEDLYATKEKMVGKARSINLEDINRVIGFEAPTFNRYTFGEENGYNESEGKWNSNNVDFYYPSLAAKSQITNTSLTPEVYKYWIKAKNQSENKEFICDAYYIYDEDGVYYLWWEGTNRDWANEGEPLSANSSWKLRKPQNIKYIVGESEDYEYAIGSSSVSVGPYGATFFSAGVFEGRIDNNFNSFCYSFNDCAYENSTFSHQVRPIISIKPNVKLEKVF